MITLRTNIAEVLNGEVEKINLLIENKNEIMREVALSLLPVVHDRIHVEGLDSNGSPIGTYSPGYMKVRTGAGFKSPVITRGDSPRPRYNRSGDPKVILSLTRQMETDFLTGVIATGDGYGIGFKNVENFNKSQYVEKTYNKKIYALTEGEKEIAVEVAIEKVSNALQ